MADIIQIRRDTAATWTSVNPLLANGEMGYETNTKKFKVGNGVDVWSLLDYHQAEFTPTIFAGAGTEGYVPDPGTEQNYFLRDDGTWQPAAGDTGGQVDSVVGGTDITVDATDPVNPIVNYTGDTGGQVNTIVGGADITVDATDPVNPIVNYTGAGGGGGIPEAPNDGLPYVRQGEAWTRGVYSAGSIVNMALVTSLPGTPDANTLYFVTG